MLSGEFTTIPLTSITVRRGDRIRKVVTSGAIEALAESIRTKGLIHPPVITRDNELVAGETRLEAMRLLGWTAAPFQFIDTLAEEDLLAIELEENIKRTDLPWQDQCDAMRKFHELHKAQNSEWTQVDTAREVGVSERTVRDYLAVAKAVASGNAMVAGAPKLSTARGIVTRQNERAASDAIASLKPKSITPATPFHCEDFNLWAPTYDGPSFNFLHCDFPYGIDAHKFNQTANADYGGYADGFDIYETLLETLIAERHRLLGESAHIIFWFSMKHYSWTLEKLNAHFWVDPYPLIWVKSDNKGTLPDPERGPRRIYEVAFLCSHGDRKVIRPVSNTIVLPTTRSGEHMSEKNPEALSHFMRMLVDANTRMLDPTCGSGSAVRAAADLGAGSVLGLERDATYIENAKRAWGDRKCT